MTASRGKRLGLLALCAVGLLLFGALGTWQVQRLAWKRDLIARVEARIHAEPMPLPPSSAWTTLDLHEAEYRRVQMRGNFLHAHETLVDAVTALGEGYWVLTPLKTTDGLVWVNRGFVPPNLRSSTARMQGQPAGEVVVSGLLRRDEPYGRILRPNRQAEDRWFSRDVQAMAEARGIGVVAPFFIDAEATRGLHEFPKGGMTTVKFRNAHFVYAVTWFALTGLCLVGMGFLVRDHYPGRFQWPRGQ